MPSAAGPPSSNRITHFKLNNGLQMPSIGLGTWKAEPGLVGQAVKTALQVGYRHIDCAAVYGNEKEIGDALQECFRSGLVKREDLWITSKLWNTHHAPEDVPQALDQTLKDLQLDYVDLYLIHWPIAFAKSSQGLDKIDFAPLNIKATWQAMENLLLTNKVKTIGVSNFTVEKLEDLLSHTDNVPSVNQVECHPLWQQHKLRKYCTSKGIHVTAYSPLGSPGSPFAKVSVLEHPTMKDVAQKLGKSTAQVALRWGLQNGYSVLPKSTNEDRLRANFEILDWSIPDEEMEKISKMEQVRLLRNHEMCGENGPYKNVEQLWDNDL